MPWSCLVAGNRITFGGREGPDGSCVVDAPAADVEAILKLACLLIQFDTACSAYPGSIELRCCFSSANHRSCIVPTAYHLVQHPSDICNCVASHHSIPARLAFGTNTRDLSLPLRQSSRGFRTRAQLQSGGFRPVARCFGSAAAFALRPSLADDASPPGPSAASTGHPSACFLRVPIDITVIHTNQTTHSEYSPYLCSIFLNYREDGRLGIKPNSEPSGSKARGQRPKG